MRKYLPPPHKFRPKTLDSTNSVDFTHFRRTVNRYCEVRNFNFTVTRYKKSPQHQKTDEHSKYGWGICIHIFALASPQTKIVLSPTSRYDQYRSLWGNYQKLSKKFLSRWNVH